MLQIEKKVLKGYDHFKRDFKPEKIAGNLKKSSPKTLPVENEFASM